MSNPARIYAEPIYTISSTSILRDPVYESCARTVPNICSDNIGYIGLYFTPYILQVEMLEYAPMEEMQKLAVACDMRKEDIETRRIATKIKIKNCIHRFDASLTNSPIPAWSRGNSIFRNKQKFKLEDELQYDPSIKYAPYNIDSGWVIETDFEHEYYKGIVQSVFHDKSVYRQKYGYSGIIKTFSARGNLTVFEEVQDCYHETDVNAVRTLIQYARFADDNSIPFVPVDMKKKKRLISPPDGAIKFFDTLREARRNGLI